MKNTLRIAFALTIAIVALGACSQATTYVSTPEPAVKFFDPTGTTAYTSGSSASFGVYNGGTNVSGTNSVLACSEDHGSNVGATYYTVDGSTPTASSYVTDADGWLDLLTLGKEASGSPSPVFPITVKLKIVSIGGTATAGAVGTSSNPFTITLTLRNS
jgi:hypothetical protein